MNDSERWPALPLAEWQDTYATLHMWSQIVGKIRLVLSPPINHFWGSTLYVTSRGLTTSPMPYPRGAFEINFDFVAHTLEINTSLGEVRSFRLVPRTVAEFYSELMASLHSLGIDVKVWTMPVEVPRPVRFNLDEAHSSYDAEYANRFWRILVSTDAVFREFRSRFIGKVSPVHFFWGSFDLAVTRFSGRRAPQKPDADLITKEAYSHEVISHGFWPGDGEVVKDAAFYAYAAPEPQGFKERRAQPDQVFYSREKNEFFLMYDDVRQANSPEKALLDFCQSTYEAGATLANWDRENLERSTQNATHA
ncbi:MAG TPA: DUF5996 family protein [Candidatus Acidoferrum sp.]